MRIMLLLVAKFCISASGLICCLRLVLALAIFQIQKSSIVDPVSWSAAEHFFGSLDIEVVFDHRFLSGASARDGFDLAKVDQWASSIHHLSHMAESQLQAAYAALAKALQCEWIFL